MSLPITVGIHSLPLELVENIYRQLDPASHLNFALVDEHILDLSDAVLKRHGIYWCTIENITDQNPNYLAHVLGHVAKDHVAAWHLRTFESSNARTGIVLSDETFKTLERRFNAAMNTDGFPAFRLDRPRFNGMYSAEFVETAVLVLSTGLENIDFKSFSETLGFDVEIEGFIDDFWVGDHLPSQQYNECSHHNFFCNAIRAYSEILPQPLWPPGFENLRTIIIGTPFSCLSHPSDGNNPFPTSQRICPQNVAPIFLLPNLNSVYICGLYENRFDIDDHPFGSSFHLPEHSTSLEHLSLECAHPGEVKHAICAIIRSARALKPLIIKDCELHDFDQLVSDAKDSYRDETTGEISLNTLLWSEEYGDMRGYRSSKFYPDEVVDGMSGIRVLTLDMGDMILCCNEGYSDKSCEDKMENNGCSHADFSEYFQWLIPGCVGSVEVLVFKMNEGISEQGLRGFAVTIIRMVNEQFENDYGDDEEEWEDESDDEEIGGGDEIETNNKNKIDHRKETSFEESSPPFNDINDNNPTTQTQDRPLPLRHIYLDEVVNSIIVESGWEAAQIQTLGKSIFEEAILKCGKHGIALHWKTDDTKTYFKEAVRKFSNCKYLCSQVRGRRSNDAELKFPSRSGLRAAKSERLYSNYRN